MDIEKVLKELTLEEKSGLCSGEDFWHTKNIDRLEIPEVMMCDGPHGLRKQEGESDHLGINGSIRTNCYPSASALAASFDRTVLQKLGEVLGEECQAENVGMLLGPGLNMKRSPLCGRNFEYFSEDPYLAGELGVSYIKGLQGSGIAACAKHFAANNQETRRMSGSSQIDERTLHEIYLPAFEKAVKEGKVRSIMCAYNAINGVFAAENKELLTDILRDDWKFDGIVVTDWGAVKDRVKGIEAGLDLEMPGGPGAQDKKIAEAVEKGELSEEKLDQTIRKLLKFISDTKEQKKVGCKINRKVHSDISLEIAENCAVLLKNESEILPLTSTNVVFVGEMAEFPRYQGSGSSHINTGPVIGAKDVQKHGVISYARGYNSNSESYDFELAQEAVEKAEKSDVVVVFAGLPEKFETEGCDRVDLELPLNQNQLIEELAKVNENIVVVLHGGAPVVLPWIDRVKAVLCMYLGGERVGEAAVDLLFGDAVPSGKLAETWPMCLEDNPSYLNFPGEDGKVKYAEDIFIGYRYYDRKKMNVLFPFGHGLSYSKFEYKNLSLSCIEMTDQDILTIEVDVINTGNYRAKEAVQIYVADKNSSVRRPIRELKAFDKVELSPGESRTLRFTLDKRAFAYYEESIHDWFVESGEFDIEAGASSRDIRLVKTVTVNGTKHIPITFSKETAFGQVLKTESGGQIFSRFLTGSEEFNDDSMGQGNTEMMKAMMLEMPLGALVSYGMMSDQQLREIIEILNRDQQI
ncbi:MAG: glycoside hydrolase family 3 C-terminal domain-containing protein [Eubacteriales bacterium]|nr:glycoside hydrolase family 3 C-terminal domain-containing protein [Eubacteriales bacterium]